MAKVRRCRLSWEPSDSEQVIGYRLYWSTNHSPDYNSNYFELGDACEVYLPDVLKLDPRYNARVMLGVTALSMNGNESDMVRLTEPYQPVAPPAPTGLLLTPLDEFSVVEPAAEIPSDQSDLSFEETVNEGELEELARIAQPLLRS